ncbi:class A beta-lactamase [Rhodoplanes azumiensis]|uniref:Beta-lactamase n=1 Tax=Rhodoplanes azumiensis TaxID=1897628 RepID=A0ABW5AJQ1_9BRAD
MIDRRSLLTAMAALVVAGPARAETFDAALARIERESGGRLGVAVIDTATGMRAGHRADERFAMCSTFKLLLAAAVLARVDAGREALDRRITIDPAALLDWAPLTRPNAGGSMTVAALAEAAMVTSDNTAANLLLGTLGGPPGLTAWLRTLGDDTSRLDRIEPALNEAWPDDPRDTTTPAAMAADIERLVLGDALSSPSRDLLTGWLVGNRTGAARLRAGLSQSFKVGEKTGTGERGATNDVGLFWPPTRKPVIVAAYLTETTAPAAARDGALAAVAKAVAASL